ncbi:hypothetical protein NW767_006440 [Fusarium falciforme]|nr:hypothetical protein NW767_006440 [Fusarium falciforme]
MASWEAAALKLQSHVAVTSDPNSLDKDKCLPPLPLQHKSTVTTKIEAITSEEDSNSTKGWKPLSLSTPILLAVIALTLLLAAAVETIAQRSAAQGGLALSPTLDDLPGYAKFSYLYVPTIIAVLYSMIWSWIDLDVKRMQPWFELSKPKGATAENSLFLDYQYDFVALVPFKAAKSRHWPVFFGGTAMVIVFWALTPLQSALLGTGIVKQTESTTIATRSQLLPVSQHVSVLDPEFLNTGYAIGWLGQQFPPFTTSKYALLPFYADKSPEIAKLHPNVTIQSNVTAVTTKMWTELNCWPAEIERSGPRSSEAFNFLNGQGCNASVTFGVTAKRKMLYIGYDTSPYSDFWLGTPTCPRTPNSTHQFLAIWAKAVPVDWDPSPSFNITALFCQPQYYKQKVLATVKSPSLEPYSSLIQELSPRESLSEKEFNSTAFEFLLANGMAQKPIVRDYPFNAVVEQHPRLNYTNFTFPVSNMVGFALAGKDLPPDDYVHTEVLHKAYNDAHQYLFSVAMTSLFMNSTEFSNKTASIEYFMTGVLVSRTFATAVECILVVVAIFTAVVLRFCRSAPSKLPLNPSSITRYIDFFGNSPELLRAFRSMDYADDEALLKEFKGDEFRLVSDTPPGRVQVVMNAAFQETDSDEKSTIRRGYYDPVRPLVLKTWVGMVFVAILIGAMIFISYLKQQEASLNGLIRPSENFEVLQLLENYIPTIFATLIEPFWVLLNRLLCVLQPFKDLWEGKTQAATSIDTTYTSIPPQLVFLRAIKSKHFVLVTVCAMALLANLLAVGLGSLFNENLMTATYPETMVPAFAPRFDNASVFDFFSFLNENLVTTNQYQDHMYVAMANISSGTILPPWISQEYYFQRYKFKNPDGNRTEDVYTVNTRGFGADANCTAVSAIKLPIYKEQIDRYPTKIKDESQCSTVDDLIGFAGPEMRQAGNNRSTGISALEYSRTVDRTFGPAPCARSLTLGWGRNAAAENVNGTVEASFMICRPIFKTAMFNVTIDSSGHVISYKRTSELETSLKYADSGVHTDKIFQNVNHQWNEDPRWHNDTTTRDWMNHLLMVTTGSRAALDPKKPVPDTKELIPAVSNIYRRVYAIMLGLNEQLFESNEKENSIIAIRHTRETRIFMEQASFIITMTVLAMNMVAALLFYIKAVAFVLPRMPTTLGSIIAYIAPSRLAAPGYRDAPGHSSRTISFGRYIGSDGEAHIGIEADPHVVPVNPLSLGVRNGFLGLFRKQPQTKEQPIRSDTWL